MIWSTLSSSDKLASESGAMNEVLGESLSSVRDAITLTNSPVSLLIFGLSLSVVDFLTDENVAGLLEDVDWEDGVDCDVNDEIVAALLEVVDDVDWEGVDDVDGLAEGEGGRGNGLIAFGDCDLLLADEVREGDGVRGSVGEGVRSNTVAVAGLVAFGAIGADTEDVGERDVDGTTDDLETAPVGLDCGTTCDGVDTDTEGVVDDGLEDAIDGARSGVPVVAGERDAGDVGEFDEEENVESLQLVGEEGLSSSSARKSSTPLMILATSSSSRFLSCSMRMSK